MLTCNAVYGTNVPYTALHVNGKMTINTGNTQAAPPSFDSSGGIGDRIVFWNGAPSSHSFSLGIDNLYGLYMLQIHSVKVQYRALISTLNGISNTNGDVYVADFNGNI